MKYCSMNSTGPTANEFSIQDISIQNSYLFNPAFQSGPPMLLYTTTKLWSLGQASYFPSCILALHSA